MGKSKEKSASWLVTYSDMVTLLMSFFLVLWILSPGVTTITYDTIIDLGTLEHIFNVPQALESIAKACEIGGQIIHVQTHADFCGHGFWQFSAELFFSWYSKANGFSNVEIFIAPLHELRYWFRCTRPNTGERCELSNKKVPHSYILVRALKEADVNHRCCQQSDYIEKWSKVDDLNDQANQKSAKTFMQTVKDVIPTPIKQNLKSFKENLKNYNLHKLYKELLNFCTLELSSFYFDIRKDVLYCDSLNSKKRQNCVIVLNIILESLLKWFSPILVFTTEEIYTLVTKEDDKSIHEENFVRPPNKWKNNKLNDKWQKLFKIKQETNIAIEAKRASKEIGSSLEADIKLSIDQKNFELLKNLDLAEYLITSKAEKSISKDNKLKIEVNKAKGDKCPRCWKILEKKCIRCSTLM